MQTIKKTAKPPVPKKFRRITCDIEESLLFRIEQEQEKQKDRSFLSCLNEALFDWCIKQDAEHERRAQEEKNNRAYREAQRALYQKV